MNVEKRLLDRLIPVTESGCWLWQGYTDSNGYGRIKIGSRTDGTRKVETVHRVSWEVHNGAIPNGLSVLHKCDTPACANPDHLFLGTQAENMKDMKNKGRAKGGTSRGMNHWNSKLTQKEVDAIRNDPRPCRQVAKEYCVSYNQIFNIQKNKSWRSP